MSRTFYFTDVHGDNLFYTAFDWCMNQDPDCTIIYGGDAIDRGPKGYDIMKRLLASPNVIYLMGNHEDMFINAAREQNPSGYATRLSVLNGGDITLLDFDLDPNGEEILDQVTKLPLTYTYGAIDFCHAGGVYNAFVDAANNRDRLSADSRIILWDRDCFDYGWAPGRVCVHGHTPTVTKYFSSNEPCVYEGSSRTWTGLKVNMDTGVFVSGRLFVLDVDTFDIYGFIGGVNHPYTTRNLLVSQD